MGSSDNSSKDKLEETTIQNNRRGTQPDTSTTSIDENIPNAEETRIQEDRSEVSKPHLKPEKLQNTITIDGQDQSSHQEITILGNTDQIATPNEIRITTQNPATITIVSTRTKTIPQNRCTRQAHTGILIITSRQI